MSKQQLKYQIDDLKGRLEMEMEKEISEKLAEIVKYISDNKKISTDDLRYALRILVDDVKNIVTDSIKVRGI